MQELLEQVQTGGVQCIIVKDFSRFGRNSIETGYLLEKVFPLFHVRFISLNDRFDSDDYKGDTGGINIAFKYLINEYYSRDLSRKTRSVKYAKMRRGEYQSRICCYGYRKGADNQLEIDEETAPTVRLIFEWAAEGCSTQEVAAKLYEQGIPTPGEHKAAKGSKAHDVSRSRHIWQRSTILRILQDERYAGTYIMGRRVVAEVGSSRSRMKEEQEWFRIPSHHPAIVDMALFDKVKAQSRRFKSPKRQVHLYPLRGKVFCGHCGHALYRIHHKRLFYCRFTQPDPAAACHGLHISETDLETVVYTIIQKQAQAILQADNHINLPALESAHSAETDHRQGIQRLEMDKRKQYEQFVGGELSMEDYRNGKAILDNALQVVRQKHAAARSYAQSALRSKEERAAEVELASMVSGETRFTRGIAEMLIERIEVYPGNRMEIKWKVSWADYGAVPLGLSANVLAG